MITVRPPFMSLVAAFLFAGAHIGASAQNTNSGAAAIAKPGVSEAIAPYDDKLLKLAEILGAIHYLRALCGAKEKNKWRDAMGAILESEKPSPNRKARMIASFNRSYRAFNSTYADCTATALLASERYMREGAQLSGQITSRYGR